MLFLLNVIYNEWKNRMKDYHLINLTFAVNDMWLKYRYHHVWHLDILLRNPFDIKITKRIDLKAYNKGCSIEFETEKEAGNITCVGWFREEMEAQLRRKKT